MTPTDSTQAKVLAGEVVAEENAPLGNPPVLVSELDSALKLIEMAYDRYGHVRVSVLAASIAQALAIARTNALSADLAAARANVKTLREALREHMDHTDLDDVPIRIHEQARQALASTAAAEGEGDE